MPRIVTIEPPERGVNIADWEEVIDRNFSDYKFPAKMCLSVISQLLINDITNPFALVLVDVPSSGKTVTLNFFSDLKNLVYTSDKFTPQSFVSHSANMTIEKLAKVDLLPRIRYKTLVVRELSVIFGQREEDLLSSLGTLTRVLDGEGLQTESGVHGQRGYQGDYLFMLLAGSTPIPPRVWKAMGNMGSRLFFLNMKGPEDTEETLMAQLGGDNWRVKEKECRSISTEFLKTLWNQYPNGVDWNTAEDPDHIKTIIVRCAMLLASLRGVINVWADRDAEGQVFNHTEPIIERPRRINQLLYNLARGHALVNGRTQLNEDDAKAIIEIALNSAQKSRVQIFDALIANRGVVSTGQLEQILNRTNTTVLQEMAKFEILKIGTTRNAENNEVGRPEKELAINERFQWFCGDEFYRLRNGVNNSQNTPTERTIEQAQVTEIDDLDW